MFTKDIMSIKVYGKPAWTRKMKKNDYMDITNEIIKA